MSLGPFSPQVRVKVKDEAVFGGYLSAGMCTSILAKEE